jgi:ABC-type lipoprotein release transport system permease subunit
LLATAGAARLLGAVNSHVPSVDSVDFATLGGLVLTLFAAIALAASYVPVRRAMAISLTAALRDE